MKVKVCGLNNKSDFSSLSKLNIDFFGFIFYEKSPRYFFDHPIDMHKDLNSVGVFVNEKGDIVDAAMIRKAEEILNFIEKL